MSVVVIGAGIAGLTATWHLLGAGVDPSEVIVLESSPRVGGKLLRAEVAGRRLDVGAESMLAARPEGVRLVHELGLKEALTAPATTSASVWSGGALWPLPKGTLMGIPADPEAARGLLSDAEVARLAAERPWPKPVTEDVAVGEYVAARLGDAVVDRLVEPLLGGVYAARARDLSMAASVPALFAAAQRGDSLLEAASAATAARAGTLSGASVFAGLVGGMGQLAEVLAGLLRDRGVTIETGVTVRALSRAGSGAGARWRLTCGPVPAEVRLDADAVVLAVPPPAAARLLGGAAPHTAALLGEVEVASMAIVTLAVERAGLPRELPGSGFLVPAGEGRTIKASTFSSGKWAWVNELSDDLVFLRASVGRAGETDALQRPDDHLVETAGREVGEAVGFPLPRVVDSHVQRWGGGLPQYAVGHLDRMDTLARELSGVGGLEVCGAAYGGVGVPAVIASARAAADRLLSTSAPEEVSDE